MPTACPKCGELDTLRQKVELEVESFREVRVLQSVGSPSVDFGAATGPDGAPIIREERDIECSSCGETWADDRDLIEGRPREYGCDSCDWWGTNEFQHGIERPDCKGELGTRA
jgi:hypothetical protein